MDDRGRGQADNGPPSEARSGPEAGAGPVAPTGVPIGRLMIGVVALPLGFSLVALAVAPLFAHRLPDPMAVHWSAGGTANGTMTLAQNEAFIAIMLLVLWGVGAVAVFVGRGTPVRFRTERAAMAWCCGVTAFMAAIAVLIVVANLDATGWDTTHFGAWGILPSLGVAAAAGFAGWRLAGPHPEPLPVPSGARPPLAEGALALPTVHLGPGEAPVWSDHLTSRGLTTITFVLLAAAVALLLLDPNVGIIAGALTFVAALACGVLSSVHVAVDGTGLTVRYGPLGWPVQRRALADIRRVEAVELEPLEWGGWGYRIVPGRSAVVLRRGPAIVIERPDGKLFAVTVDDAVTGAALLEAYRRRDAAGI